MEELVVVDRSSTSMADLTPLRTCTNEAQFNAFLVEITDQITKDEVPEQIVRSSYKVSPDWLDQTIGNNRVLKIQNGGR